MNHIYKLKFDKRRNELVVVSEITPGLGKVKSTGTTPSPVSTVYRKGRTLKLSLLSGMMLMTHSVMAANLPTGGQIVAGSGSIQTPSANQMQVHQNTQNMVTNWHSFDIGAGHSVQFFQPDSSAVALNRVTGGSESKIMGNLSANGQVFLVNPNGMLFGKGASVNTAGFVASTRDIKSEDFMKGQYTFSEGAKAGAEIINQGNLTTAPGGYIVLAADRVKNNGTILTPGGKAVLAAGETVTLQLDRSGLTSVQASGDVVNALVENSGLVSATNGQVYLTALGKNMLLNTVLNVSGVVEASGATVGGSNVVLNGGNSGVVHLSGQVTAGNAGGRGGKVVVQGENILLDKQSLVSATGSQGGGEVYIGGGWQGKDSSIRNASKVVMQKGARIDVSATQTGHGGRAVLWSDDYTNFRGAIVARGGELGGNGGQVETSSKTNLQAFGGVDASAKRGNAGNWLLDPLDIKVVNGNDSNVTKENDKSLGTSFFPTARESLVSNASINNELNNGTSVTILTSCATAGGAQAGNITVDASISKTLGNDATLTLLADGNITVNNNITSTTGKLNITLLGAGSNSGRIWLNNATLSSNGGNITLGRMDGGEANALTVKVQNSNLTTTNTNGNGNGNITISAWNPNVDLSVSNYNGTVRNAGSLLEVNNSTLTGNNITLTGNQSGANSKHIPVYLDKAILNATKDINLTGLSTDNSKGVWLELRGNNTLTTSGGNITISHNTTNNTDAVRLNGSSSNSINLTASNGYINITGQSGGTSVQLTGTNVTAQGISLTGNAGTQTGVSLNNVSLNATRDNITINGSSNGNSNGVTIMGNNTLAANEGNITINGNTAGNSSAVYLNGNNTLTALNGSINLHGKSANSRPRETDNYGSVLISKYANLNGSQVNISGIDNSGRGAGVGFFNANLTLGGDASISGDGGVGVLFAASVKIESQNNISINGNGTAGSNAYTKRGGILFQQNIWTPGNTTISAKSINMTGYSSGSNASGVEGDIYSYNNQVKTNVTLNATNISINGTSDTGDGVRFLYLTIISENAEINGTSKGSRSGVQIAGNLTNTTINGESNSGNGVTVAKTKPWSGGLNQGSLVGNGNTSINGTSNTGNGVYIFGDVDGLDSINGSSVNGSGVDINGSVSGGNVTGSSTGSGTGVGIGGDSSLNNTTVSGSGVDGSGVGISGNSTLTNTTVNGNTSGNGYGVGISGNSTLTGNSSVSGNATGGNGTGVDINGNLSGGTVTGNATGNGTGVDISGNITDGTITGDTENGSGVGISGNSTLTNTTVNGNTSGNGTGVDINGNLSGGTVTGNATGNGTGVELAGNVTKSTVNGTSQSGTGLHVTGRPSTVTDSSLSASSVSGPNVVVSGELILNNSTLSQAGTVSSSDVRHYLQQQETALQHESRTGSEVADHSSYRIPVTERTLMLCSREGECSQETFEAGDTRGIYPVNTRTGVVFSREK
ncbi:filamentous hemagglutinin N-terminal domain-containing protein [Escherichia coli]|uniref:two-partner secretion domain-containing protein n=2 Tax=Escherichia coli TaxID=562 RepID=UPI0004D9F099|nr:filamentous hemagglutinin N-terminal domain-containing protein [Escherichia coli]KEN34655.1 filamentous hemagglutinin family N-terminal domain protein [Escherichia coli 7-233-03_S3_C2]